MLVSGASRHPAQPAPPKLPARPEAKALPQRVVDGFATPTCGNEIEPATEGKRALAMDERTTSSPQALHRPIARSGALPQY